MKLDDFLEAVLPPEGNYFVEYNTWPGDKHIKQKVSNLAAASLLIRQKSQRAFDTWIAIGSFGETRQAKDCKKKKALYVDIDCGPTKAYSNSAVAAKHLVKACSGNHLPNPSIVLESGNGLHIYWVLDKPIPAGEWKTLARKLKAACRNAGLDVDSKVTTDPARILRPPETFNMKDRDHPKRVVVGKGNYHPERLYNYNSLSLMLPVEVGPDDDNQLSGAASSSPAALAAAVSVVDMMNGVDMGPFNSKKEHEQTQLAQQMLSHLKAPKYFTYDNWLRVGAALFDAAGASMNPDTSEWKDLWDGWSQHSDKYDAAEIEEKWEEEFPKFRDVHIASLIYMAAQEGFVFPNAMRNVDYPPGYIATDFGTIREPRGEEDSPTFVMSAHLHDVEVCIDKECGVSLTARSINPISKRRMDLEVSTVSLNNGGAKDEIGRAGVSIRDPRHMKEISMFMDSFMDHIAKTRGVSDAVNSFGWCHRGGQDAFATGRNVYWEKQAPTEGVTVAPELRDLYTPQGGLATWQNVVQPIINQGRQEINVAIATAFASPLIKFTGITGTVLSLYSRDSGTGKSTALRAAQSVWGRPQGGVLALDDTINAVTKRLEMLQNLPAYWDEVRMHHVASDFIKMIFQLSQGKGKSRLNSAAKLQHTGTWNTLITVAGNERLHSHMDRIASNTNAGALRLFELEVSAPGVSDQTLTQRMGEIDAVEENYGTAGGLYATWLAQNMDLARNIVKDCMAKFDTALGPTQDERFWLALVSTLYAGAYIATLKIHVLRFDLKALRAFLVDAFMNHRRLARTKTSSSSAVKLLAEFLQTHKPNSITTDRIVHLGKRGRPARVDIHWPQTLSDIRHPIVYQHGLDGCLLVQHVAFKEWLFAKKGMTHDATVEELKKLGATVREATIAAGTTEAAPRSDTIICDLASGPLSTLF
jgi:hypothetical protein